MRYLLRSLKSPHLIFSKNNSWSFHNNFYDTRTFPWYSVRVSVPSFFSLKIAYTGHEWTWAWHEILNHSFSLSTVSRDDSFRRFALNDLTVRPWQSFIVSSQASRNVSSKRNNHASAYIVPLYNENQFEKRYNSKFDEYMNGINEDGKLQRFSLGFGRRRR